MSCKLVALKKFRIDTHCKKPTYSLKLHKTIYIFSMGLYKVCKCIFKRSGRYLPTKLNIRKGDIDQKVGKDLCFIYNVLFFFKVMA